jgi:hypothetical protein
VTAQPDDEISRGYKSLEVMAAALAISLILMAGGAILVWGVENSVAGVDLDVIGIIGLVVGIIGVVLALLVDARGRTPVDRPRRRDYTVER